MFKKLAINFALLVIVLVVGVFVVGCGQSQQKIRPTFSQQPDITKSNQQADNVAVTVNPQNQNGAIPEPQQQFPDNDVLVLLVPPKSELQVTEQRMLWHDQNVTRCLSTAGFPDKYLLADTGILLANIASVSDSGYTLTLDFGGEQCTISTFKLDVIPENFSFLMDKFPEIAIRSWTREFGSTDRVPSAPQLCIAAAERTGLNCRQTEAFNGKLYATMVMEQKFYDQYR